MKSMDSPYEFRLIARPDKLEFYITTTRPSDAQREKTRLELHFIAHGETTTVEMRQDAIGDRMLSSETWTIIERCSRQVATPPVTSPTAPYPHDIYACADKRAAGKNCDSIYQSVAA